MPHCSEYRIAIEKSDPWYSFFERLQKERIANSILDAGFPGEIDYQKIGQPPEIQGSGDCIVTPEEVREYVVTRWQRYREPLEKWFGKKLPWDVGSDDPAFRNFLNLVEQTLQNQGYAPHSPSYGELKALSIFWWFLFPGKEFWKLASPQQKEEFSSQLQELREKSLTPVIEYLEKVGGKGQHDALRTEFDTSAARLKPSGWSILELVGVFSEELYGYFAAANLEASLVQLIWPAQEDPSVCSLSSLLNVGVGIFLGDEKGWRVFYPMRHDSHGERFPFYPNSLADRLVLLENSFAGLSERMKKIGVRLEEMLQNDKPEHWRPLLEEVKWNPFFVWSFLAKTVSDEARLFTEREAEVLIEFTNQGASVGPWKDIILSYIALRREDWEKAQQHAEAVLQRDPKCLPAIRALGRIYQKQGNLQLANEIYSKAAAIGFRPEDYPGNFYLDWGRILLELGKSSDALSALEFHSKRKDIAVGKPSMQPFYLAVAAMQLHDKKRATKALAQVLQANWFTHRDTFEEWMRDWKKENESLSLESVLSGDAELKQLLAAIYRRVGDAWLFYDALDQALEWYEKSRKIQPEDPELNWRLKEIQLRRRREEKR